MMLINARNSTSSVVILQDGVVGKEARCPSQQGEVSYAKTVIQISSEEFSLHEDAIDMIRDTERFQVLSGHTVHN